MSLVWECVCVQSYERILGSVFLERVVQSQKAGKVLGVSDQSCPHCARLDSISLGALFIILSDLPLAESTTLVLSVFVESAMLSFLMMFTNLPRRSDTGNFTSYDFVFERVINGYQK